ncbi:MAG: exonuclease domain-containing protein [Gammaproteobacteria bacterium]|jgi:DNA polymerase-3 subunit epsilon
MAAFDEPIACVDVETTGGHPAWHRITEIAIVGVRAGEVEWEWSQLVNPGGRIPPSIQQLTGISDEMVADAPPFAAIADEVEARLAGRRFVAHNARFDYGFVRTELRRLGRPFSAPLACTVRLSRDLYPEQPRHNLDAIIARHGLECASRHRALPDAQVLAQLWGALRREWPAEALDAALDRVGRRPSLPSHLSPDLVDDLPEACGVYRFIGEGDALLYVGKALNLRERVLSHFMSAGRDAKSQRLSAQVRRIEWTETAGELGALLLEARVVRESKPVYNRRLRGGGELFTWRVDDDGSAPQLTPLEGPLPAGDVFGLYRSARQARTALTTLAREQKLCLRVLGLEQGGEGSCFGHQVGRCAGACVGAEPRLKHNLRLKLALAPHKLRSWPYKGAVALEETSAMGLRQWHVLDGWQYLGSVQPDEVDPAEATRGGLATPQAGFDPDVYRILARHLTRTRKGLRPWPPADLA